MPCMSLMLGCQAEAGCFTPPCRHDDPLSPHGLPTLLCSLSSIRRLVGKPRMLQAECNGEHEHVRLEGSGLTKKAESNPAMLVKAILGVVRQWSKLKMDANMAKDPSRLMIPAMLHQCAENINVTCTRKSMSHFDVNPSIPIQWDSAVVRRTIDRRTGVAMAENILCYLEQQQTRRPFQRKDTKRSVHRRLFMAGASCFPHDKHNGSAQSSQREREREIEPTSQNQRYTKWLWLSVIDWPQQCHKNFHIFQSQLSCWQTMKSWPLTGTSRTIGCIKMQVFLSDNGKVACCSSWRMISGSTMTPRISGCSENAHNYHGVTEVKGYRLSLIYHIPHHLPRLNAEDWQSLRDAGFPVDVVWESGLPVLEDVEDDELELIAHGWQAPTPYSRQQTPVSEAESGEMNGEPALPDSTTMRPTLQAILWLSDLIANAQLHGLSINMTGPRLDRAQVQEDMNNIINHARAITDTTVELSMVAFLISRILISAVRLPVQLGLQCHFGLMLLHILNVGTEDTLSVEEEDPHMGILRAISMIPTTSLWEWVPNIHSLTRLRPRTSSSEWQCSSGRRGPPEAAHIGHECEICHTKVEETGLCDDCNNVGVQLSNINCNPTNEKKTILDVLTSLDQWASEIPTWNLVDGLRLLTRQAETREIQCNQMCSLHCCWGNRRVWKTLHMEPIMEELVLHGFSTQALSFQKGRTPLGRFLKRQTHDAQCHDLWIQHALFSLHRGELMPWLTQLLELG